MIVPQQAAEPLAALDLTAGLPDFVAGLDDSVGQPLVVSFFVIVQQVLANAVSEHLLAKEYPFQKTLVLDASHEPFDVWRQIGRSRRKSYTLDACVLQSIAKGIGELRVTVHNQIACAIKKPVLAVDEVSRDLFHPDLVWARRASGKVNPTAATAGR